MIDYGQHGFKLLHCPSLNMQMLYNQLCKTSFGNLQLAVCASVMGIS
jgi:hypothetical protein